MSKTKGVDEARTQGREVIDDLERVSRAVFGAEERLAVAWRLFQKDPAPWRAMEALGLAVQAHISSKTNDALQPEEPVSVPGWILFELFKVFKSWEEKSGGVPFGVCLGLEGLDRRTPSSYQKWRQEERDRHLAICVAQELAVEKKVELAVPVVAKKLGLSARTVWDAWSQHEVAARIIARQLQQTP